MAEFKVGDVVEITEDYYEDVWYKGDRGVVDVIPPHDGFVWVQNSAKISLVGEITFEEATMKADVWPFPITVIRKVDDNA